MLGPDSFDSMSFQISKLLCLPPECLVYGELRFQNILNRKLMNIFISVPKMLDSSDHAHLDRNKQDFIQLTKQFRVFRQDINRFSRFLHHSIGTKNKLTK